MSAQYSHGGEGDQLRHTHKAARRALFEPVGIASRGAKRTRGAGALIGGAGAIAGISAIGFFWGAGIRSTGRGRRGGTRLQQLAGSHPSREARAAQRAGSCAAGRLDSFGADAALRPAQH